MQGSLLGLKSSLHGSPTKEATNSSMNKKLGSTYEENLETSGSSLT